MNFSGFFVHSLKIFFMKRNLLIIARIIGFFIALVIIAGRFQFWAEELSGLLFTQIAPGHSIYFFVGQLGAFIGTIVVIYIFTRWVDKIPFVDIGLQMNRFNDFYKGLIFGFIPIALGFGFLYNIGLITDVKMNFDGVQVLLVFGALVFVAFNEEAFLRGYVLRNLMLISNKYVALLISALLFAALHLGNDHIDLIGFTNIFLAGILLGLSYIYTKNLWFPIGLHLAWNFSQSLFGFNVSGNSTYSLISYQLSDEMTWLSGGEFGFEASALSLVFLVIMIGIVYLMFRKEEDKI